MSRERQRFAPDELAVVLSHYDIGVIQHAREFARGSRRSPKLLMRSAQGRYLLKRRAAGRDRPQRVRFAHELLEHLRRKGFPVPTLLATRDGRSSLLRIEQRSYELFEYADGQRYDGSLEQTTHAGKTLARFHRAVADLPTPRVPARRAYHDSPAVRQGLNAIPTTTASHDSVIGHEAELLATTQELYERYDEAARAAEACGLSGWPQWIIHGDWHPGNMLFRHGRVVVVLDFDAARPQPRVIDVANGLLQFSILRGAGDPGAWPTFFDGTRFRRFWRGYRLRQTLSGPERASIPHLMVESLIAESVVPIAATGSFGPMPGFGVLQMVRRKVRWLLENGERLRSWLSD